MPRIATTSSRMSVMGLIVRMWCVNVSAAGNSSSASADRTKSLPRISSS